MAEDIKNKTAKGIGWSALDSIASQGVTFLVGIVLARLLSPEEFGTIGVAMIFVSVFNRIVDCGFSNALIRKQDVKEIDYNTTFLFNLALSGTLYGVCYLCAPFISTFFHNNALTDVVRVISLVLIINAFAIIQRTHLVKDINFKTQAKVSLSASVASGIIGIVMAYKGFGVWSLVFQQISRQLINTCLLWVYNTWRPKLEFSANSFKELFAYGGKLMASGIIDTIFNEITTLFIGRIYTPATLGQYSRAKQFSSIFSTNVSTVMERVTYPVLSKMQGDEKQLLYNYKKIIGLLMFVTGVGTVLIACCAKSIILILLGSKWAEAILYLQLLAFVEITIPIKNVNLNLLQVYGRSDYILKLSIIKRIIELSAVCLGFISLTWMLVGFAIAGLIGFLLNAYYTNKVSGYRVIEQVRDLMRPFGVCLIVGLLVYPLSLVVENNLIAISLQLVVAVASIILVSNIFRLSEYYFMLNLIKSFVSKYQ